MISTKNNKDMIDSSTADSPSKSLKRQSEVLVSTDHERLYAPNGAEEIADKKAPAVGTAEAEPMPHTSGEEHWLNATADDGNIGSEELEITVDTEKNEANQGEASTSTMDMSDDNAIPDLSDT